MQYIIGGLFGLIVLYNLGVQFARANPNASSMIVSLLIIGCFVGLYFAITRLIFGSSSYQNWERSLRYKRLERERINAEKKNQAEWQAAADASMAEWQNNPLPTPDQFAKTLFYQAPLMAEMNEVTFTPQYVLRYAYQSAELNPATNSLTQGKWFYHHFEQAAIEALKGYVDALPKQLLTINDESLFTTRVHLDHASLEPAYRALAQPFRDTDFSAFYSFVKEPPLIDKPKRDDYYDDGKFDERKYDRADKEYQKALDDQWESLTPVQRALWNTPLYPRHANFTEQEITLPFPIPTEQRFAGTWIVAPPGRGKTNLLHHLVAADRQRGTVVLMDSKGDLINGYKGYGDVVIIEPSTVRINPFQLGSSTRTLDFLEYIFSALLETKLTPKQTTLFRSVLALMLKIPNATVETFRKVLVHGWRPYQSAVMQLDETTRDFFFVEGGKSEFDGPQYNETKGEVLQRLRLIISNDYLKQIFTVPQSNVNFFELLDSRKTIIIDNSKDALGENGAEFFGRFFVALVWMAAVSRSHQRQQDKVPVYFYIDECHTVIKRDTKVTTILDECRSQKIALILAHQRIAQIEPHVIDALNNCAIRMANSDDDAEALAKRFRVEANSLRLPVGKFACYVRDKTPQAITIDVREFDTSQFPPLPTKIPIVPKQRTNEISPEPPAPEPQPLPSSSPRKKGR